jgi:hypothetical protein
MVVGNHIDSKLAMSRALGAAFLSHQVEQLERSASSPAPAGAWRRDIGRGGAAPRGVNDRQRPMTNGAGPGGSPPKMLLRRKDPGADSNAAAAQGDVRLKRRFNEGPIRGKDADVIVLDASVLVHCFGQVKAWCRDGREEILVVPLEGTLSHHHIMVVYLNLG